MEKFLLSFSSVPTTSAGILAVIFFLYYALRTSKRTQNKARDQEKPAPEAAGGWPVIGHLHLLARSQLLHRVLAKMADKYGPIFTIKLGVHPALVVSNSELAKECFTVNDKAFANRPKSVAIELMGYNYALFGFGPYSPYWRLQRKIATLKLLSAQRLETLRHIHESEAKASIKEIYRRWEQNASTAGGGSSNALAVEMKQWFWDIALNTVFRIMAGKRFNDQDGEYAKIFRDFLELTGAFVVADALPFLKWLDLGGQQRRMRETGRRLDHIMEEWLEEHKRKRVAAEAAPTEEQDFMDVMLSVVDGGGVPSDYDPDVFIKSTCLALVLGGSDTSTVTLVWALCLLLNNPHTLKKAQQELDTQVGRQQQLHGTHIKHLVYVQAIIKETMRLYPAAPLGAPHESIEDCIVGDHHVPAGTRLVVNLWKVHRDPQVWPDPDEFRPERFLTTHKDVDVRGQNFELIPFSSGRRMCPGVSFSLQVTHFILANLLHGFEIATPDDNPVDMGECFGLTMAKATPLEVLLSPRLPSHLYV
ncbi:cytochrome P450 CYP82D47-like [Malania oleifera]|uniref:cytochrome P450 CYP82D47-like n=1 Tax=Malania oleifera TaxID=397392 RepID=UPI0025AE772B|nr:cytochrome P450 CYP82D47-like [Malania oleifera]